MKVYITQEQKLYLAQVGSAGDVEYQTGDDWLKVALQIEPRITLSQAAIHIDLLKRDIHPEQLKSRGQEVMIKNEDENIFVLSARVAQRERTKLVSSEEEVIADAEAEVVEVSAPALNATNKHPTITPQYLQNNTGKRKKKS